MASRNDSDATMPHYAHSLPDNDDRSRWETMHQHEEDVAKLCREFLVRIHSDLADWGDLLGRWHDLGKYSDAFQQYICESSDGEASAETLRGRVDHSTAGTQHADRTIEKIGRLLSYCIAGHHAGLPDWQSRTSNPNSGLDARLRKAIEDCSPASAKHPKPPDQFIRQDALTKGVNRRVHTQEVMATIVMR